MIKCTNIRSGPMIKIQMSNILSICIFTVNDSYVLMPFTITNIAPLISTIHYFANEY